MKQLILDDGIQSISFNEVFQKFQNLIWKLTRRWKPSYYRNMTDIYDLYQIACTGFWKAYRDYDISRNIKFITVAQSKINAEFMHFHRDYKRWIKKNGNMAKQIEDTQYFSEVIFDSRIKVTVEDSIGYEDDFSETIDIRQAIYKLDENIRMYLVAYFYEDLSQVQISKISGTSQNNVSLKINKAIAQLRAIMGVAV